MVVVPSILRSVGSSSTGTGLADSLGGIIVLRVRAAVGSVAMAYEAVRCSGAQTGFGSAHWKQNTLMAKVSVTPGYRGVRSTHCRSTKRRSAGLRSKVFIAAVTYIVRESFSQFLISTKNT